MIIKKDKDIIAGYFQDTSNVFGGNANEVAIAQNNNDVLTFLEQCNNEREKVTISGAGTGNTGGRIPFGGKVLSIEKLNNIVSVIKKENGSSIVAEAGVPIQTIKEIASSNGLFYPYDPTEQSAFLGGTVATNASGARSFKYGSTRNSVISLKVALADGGLLDIKRGEVKASNGVLNFSTNKKEYSIKLPDYKLPLSTKSSAGYYIKNDMDLIDLFIGQEGTLGCILEVGLKLLDSPKGILSCFAFFNNEEDVLSFVLKARELSNIDSSDINALSIEFFDRRALDILSKKYSDVPNTAQACVFFEQDYFEDVEDQIVQSWINLLNEYNIKDEDIIAAVTEKDRQQLIDRRHYIAEQMGEEAKKSGMQKVATDLAVPHEHFREMFNFYREILNSVNIKSLLFGHIGDSHLHMNIIPDNNEEYNTAKDIALQCVKKAISLNGTISAEHGVGKIRKEYLKLMYGKEGIDAMIKIKKQLDPNLILGLGNIFDI